MTFTLSGAPAGAVITSGGVFTWTPTEVQGPGVYVFTVVVTDDGTPNLNDSETITVTVNEVNTAPVLDPVGDQTIDEETLLTFTATASDVDLPPDTLTFTLSGAPAGAVITSGGVFTWTPTEVQGPGVYVFTVVVTDDGTPNLNDSETITVTVNEVNTAPVLDPVGDQTIDEETLLTFTATASDVDLPPDTLTFTLSGAPAGAVITSGGVFTWTPTEVQGPGVYVFTVVVTDDGTPNLNDSETITVTVNEVNTAPVLDPVGDQTIDEETLLTFTATASDVDLPPDTLTFTLSGAPAGAVITSGGVFTWTPTEVQGPGVYVFTVVVTDDGTPNLNDSETITVTVNEVNTAPVLDPVGDQTIDEETLLTFTATASDVDLPPDTLTFTLSGAPAGAVITSGGVFTWTPTEVQGPGVYVFTVVVTDDGTPNLNDSETITVTVNEVNTAPVLDPVGDQTIDEETLLTFTATASDVDLPPDTLTFTLSGAPAGAVITSGGVFTWTPTEVQGPGVYVFTVVVTDDGTPNLNDSETITVTVNEVNTAPVLDPVGDQTIDEETLLTFTATASDVDLPPDTLTFTLSGAPAGAVITSGGVFTWTPTEVQGPGVYVFTVVVTDDGTPNLNDSETITVTVNEVNTAPVLDPVGDQTIDEETLLTFTATASDVDLPPDTLTFTLSGAPAGAVITSGGVFTWTPTEVQGPGVYVFTVVVTDDGTPNLNDSETITVTVNEVNTAPVLDPVGDQTIDEETLLTFTATASDVDLPPDTLTFTLSGAPAGAVITSGGVFTWTPTEVQGPGVYVFTVVVTDDGTPNLNDSETIRIKVDNRPPVAVDDLLFLDEDTAETFDVTSNDSDPDGDSLNIVSVSQPSEGTVIVAGPGTVFYLPPLNFWGTTSFTYTVSDGAGGEATATVFVDVASVNDAPLARADEYRFD